MSPLFETTFETAVTLDLVFTVGLSGALIGAGAFALWLLPWSDADQAGTSRAMTSLVFKAIEAVRPRHPVLAREVHLAPPAALSR